ncbi:MAG: acylneuraminate cytidylyltransferase family protein [Armatimonadetes bacterium]|nr:acylneuraminate cytidylyltransferase family protein [Armatimonadota bacterium]
MPPGTVRTVHEVLGIIPARGGSKGVPRKNLQPLAGKALILWTVEAAQAARTITRLVVSTDDEEIAAIAAEAGAEVIRRPPELAQDTSPTEPALFHVLETLRNSEDYEPEALALLQCTSPLRGPEIIDEGVNKLFATGCDAVMTVTPIQHWYLAGTIREGDVFVPEYDYHKRPRSQDMPEKYRENGALYVTRIDAFYRFGNRLGGEVRVIVMDPVRSIDIDSWEDFRLAEEALRGLSMTRRG